MQRKVAGTPLSRFHRLVTILLLPLALFHLAWVTPVVQWSCLCPDNDQDHHCCCNCPKCVKNRGGLLSYCHLRAHGSEQALTDQSHSAAYSPVTLSYSGSVDHGRGDSELSICPCNSHIKEISLDIQPFLLQATSNSLRSSPIVGILLTRDCWPPEADPCQPDHPG